MSERPNEMTLEPRWGVVQWIGNDGGHKVGRSLGLNVGREDRLLVLESHTGEVKAVLPEIVSHYPSSPIPEPTK